MANTIILEAYLRTRQTENKISSIVGIDVTKAFDTVSHHSVRRALERKGLDASSISYIMKALTNNITTFKIDGKTTRPFLVNGGVKQGDPLSPFLFNLVLDEFLERFYSDQVGGTINSNSDAPKISALAFADDLLLLDDDPTRLQIRTEQLAGFLSKWGMAINCSKCFSISTQKVNEALKSTVRGTFKIGDNTIPAITHINPARYLGQHFSTGGILKPNLTHKGVWLYNVNRSPLKPAQKLAIIKEHIVPKISYFLQGPQTTAGQLRSADILIKGAAKQALHHWEVHKEPHIRHSDGTLYKPDLVVIQPNRLIVCDIAVNWGGSIPLSASRLTKKLVYDHPKFRDAIAIKWPEKATATIVEPIILGARGIWPAANHLAEALLNLNAAAKGSWRKTQDPKILADRQPLT